MADETVTTSAGESQGGADSGTIRWVIDKASEWDGARCASPAIEVHGISWNLKARKKFVDEEFWLLCILHGMKNESTMWSMDADIQFTLINSDISENITKEYTVTLNSKMWMWGSYLIRWNDLIDEDQGYICDNTITIEVRFTLRNIMGIRIIPRFDFTNSDEPCHDITLIINGENVHVSKQFLSIHSPVFRTMFYGDFAEKDKKEIELKEIEHKDFIDLLGVLYPTGKKITDDNAERLLSVADRFQIKMVLDQVEKFLITSTKFTIADKLKLSGDYRLVELQGVCLDSLKTISDITALKHSSACEKFPDATKMALYEKMMRLGD